MSRPAKPLLPLTFCTVASLLVVSAFIPTPVQAASEVISIMQSQDQNQGQEMTEEQLNADAEKKAIEKAADDIVNAITAKDSQPDEKPGGDTDDTILSTYYSLPMGLAIVDKTTRDILHNRLLELNLIRPGEGQTVADFLVDPAAKYRNPQTGAEEKANIDINVSSQIYDIFMRYFCDPKARGGTMATIGKPTGQRIVSAKHPEAYVGCGAAYLTNANGSLAQAVPSRARVFGVEDPNAAPNTADAAAYLLELQRDQIKNLPLKPQVLFFDPQTFPVNATGTTSNDSNTNKMADLYYGAFAQAMHFMVGIPKGTDLGKDSIEEFMGKQGNIARQMLASYPFAVLFSERVGSLDSSVAYQVGEMLTEKLGPVLQNDVVRNRVNNLKRRKNLSIAEYMDVVMYQVPMSPGYLTRIGRLKEKELLREEVWLTAMQTVLNYQRNRWLEIQMALEAAKQGPNQGLDK